MNLLAIVRIVCVVCTGMLAGIYFGDRMGYTHARAQLNASSFVQGQKIIHPSAQQFAEQNVLHSPSEQEILETYSRSEIGPRK